MISEVVLDGGGHFSPAGIVRVHTLCLLLLSQAEHDRAAVDSHTQDKTRHVGIGDEHVVGTVILIREVLTPSPCE